MAKVLPREGKWTVRNERFIDGKTLGHWGLLEPKEELEAWLSSTRPLSRSAAIS